MSAAEITDSRVVNYCLSPYVNRMDYLEAGNYDVVEGRMLNPDSDRSFVSGMARAVETEPTAFLVTAKSAIPVADSIRGFYEEAGLDTPVIDHIYVPRHSFTNRLRFYIERKRLEHALAGASDNVWVIDEFVFTGGTLERAGHVLGAAGVRNIREIRGNWYQQARAEEMDIDRATSVHAPKMREIGRKACLMAA